MKILITGGAGFIGSHLSDALLAAGHEITIIDDLSSGTKDFLPKEAEFLKMDIRDEKLTDIFKERHFDIIYHEAAQTMVPASIDNPYLDADINISGMLRVLEAARKAHIHIPTLCYLKGINEIGACRICVVEVKGAKSLVASCVYPVAEGMEVYTNTERVRKSRQLTLELILSNHRMDCLT